MQIIAIFDDINYPKMLTLQPHIGLQNGLHRSDAGAMTIVLCGLVAVTVSVATVIDDRSCVWTRCFKTQTDD